MEYLQNLTKGSGKGKIAAFISLTFKIISFKKYGAKSPKNFALCAYKEYLEKYVGYDKVYIISHSDKVQKCENEYFKNDVDKGLIIYNINTPNLFNDLKIDDIFCTQHPMTFFGGVLYDTYFSIANRLVEWYKVHGDFHFYTIQDDPEYVTINPAIGLDKRIKPESSLHYDRNTEQAKLYVEYRKTELLHKCLNNTIVAHCGLNYPEFYERRKAIKITHPNIYTYAKYWCNFPAFTFQGVNHLLDKKLVNFAYNRKYVSEYHGYVKHDEKRITTTLNYYNALNGKIKVIEGKAHFSDDFINCDKFNEMSYYELLDSISSESYSSLILANESTYNDFISPRYFDIMCSDLIAFVYYEYDEKRVYTKDSELKKFMYVTSPEDFNEKVQKIANDEKFFRHIKYLQRKSIYDMFKKYMLDESKKIFKNYLDKNKCLLNWNGEKIELKIPEIKKEPKTNSLF